MAISVGTGGTVVYSVTEWQVKKWEFTDSASEVDTSDTATNFYKSMVCIRKGTGKFEVDYDSTIGIPTMGIATPVAFVLTEGTGGGTITGNGIITSCPIILDARGVISWSAEFETYGTFA